jgi:predicted O-methyltransferase YrrM
LKIYPIIKFLNYTITARHKRGGGIDSPFILNIIVRIFRNKITPDIVFKTEMIRTGLKSDKRRISITDYGTGSSACERRPVMVSRQIRKTAIPRKYGELLSGFSSEFGNPCVIELGTSFGISTMYLASGNKGATVYTMEGCPETAEIAKENFQKSGLENICLLVGRFEELIPQLEEKKVKPGLVFIDGNHRKYETLEYFNSMVAMGDENVVLIFDDIYYSREMKEAWEEIKNDNRISSTIDIYRMGIVFLRPEMSRTHYKIRY